MPHASKILARLIREDLPMQITLANLAGFSLTFVSIPLIARAIGPAGRGETAAALAAFAILPTVLGLGIPLESRRRSTQGLDGASVRAARDLIAISVIPAAAIGALFSLTIYSEVSFELRILALVGLALAPVTVSWATDAGILMGLGRYRAVALLRVAHPTITLLVIITAALTESLTAPLVLVANLLGTVVTGFLGLILCRVSSRGPRASHAILLRSGARFAGSAMAESASSRLDQMVVLPLIGATGAGLYSVAASVALLPLALGQALAADHFRKVATSTSRSEVQLLSGRAIQEAVSVSLPACLVFVMISAPALPLVFGEEFVAAVPVFLLLAPGALCVTVGYVASMLLAAQGRGKAMTALQVGGLGLGMALLFGLGPIWGAVGAAVASSVAYLAVLIGQLVVLRVGRTDLSLRTDTFRAGLASLWPSRPRA